MLDLLHIENIAVIEQADIRFAPGFNVLTGETGAGKSIVIDAISAILGERAYRDVIRTGATSAFVSAVFTDVPEFDWFSDHRIDYDSNELLIQREIFSDGKNVCRVNGRPVSVSILKQLGLQLINIHGQHDSQQLFDEQTHLHYLDMFARNDVERNDYRAKFDEMLVVQKQIERLSMDESEKLRRVEMLQHQISEIERAELTAQEDAVLESRRKTLQNAEKLTDSLTGAVTALYGDDDRSGALELVCGAEKLLDKITRYDDQSQEICTRLSDLSYSLQDIAAELRDRLEQLSYSEDELEQIESRLDIIHRLKRKYGASVEEILDFYEAAKEELDEIEFSDARIAQLEAQLAQLRKKAVDAAESLRRNRLDAAKRLEAQLSVELAALDMPRAQLVCCFEEQPLSEDGADRVRFLMTANVGEALKPMSKVASGGELARIMLAIKNVLAEQDDVHTLIFDEVDAGVSGRAAQKVALKLGNVSKGKQVLCVTHLPQIAAAADAHLLISKSEKNGRTYTVVETLDLQGRTKEIARIIGGAEITDTTLKSAAEMISLNA